MEQVRLFDKPQLRKPILITAFAGWNDAAQSASSALRFLLRRWSARKIGEIEPDEFFDFTQTRPTVRFVDGTKRKIEWPANEWFCAQDIGPSRDYVLLLGVEPSLRWQCFAGSVLSVCNTLGVEMLVSLGALLAEVPHSAPTRVIASSNDSTLAARLQRLDTQTSHYEGPTGILGVLNASAGDQGLRTASIWGSVPMYLQAIPNPIVTKAILQRLSGLLDLGLHLRELEELGRQFDRQVADVIANNPQIATYVQQLEEKEKASASEKAMESQDPIQGAPDLPPGRTIVEDIEDFLRHLQKDNGGQSD